MAVIWVLCDRVVLVTLIGDYEFQEVQHPTAAAYAHPRLSP